jgi:hypothetical protein
MRTQGSVMKKQSKQAIQDEVKELQGIALNLYKALSKTPHTPESLQATGDFMKYIMEKL